MQTDSYQHAQLSQRGQHSLSSPSREWAETQTVHYIHVLSKRNMNIYTCNVIWKFKMHLWHYITERTKQQVVSGVQSYLAISTGLLENSFWTCKKENGGKETVRNMVCGVVNTDKWVKSLVSKRVGCEEEWDRVTCPIRPIPQVLTSSATSTWALYLRLQVWPSLQSIYQAVKA